MRPFAANVPIVPAKNGFEGSLGVAMYVGAAGVDDPKQIEYRRIRTFGSGVGWFVVSGDWAPGTNAFLGDVVVSRVTSPTETITYSLPAAYSGQTFWVQLRTYKDGIEHQTLWRPQRVTVDATPDSSDTIDGTGRITAIQKRDAGGLRVEFEYYAALTGIQPTEFELSRTAGPTSPTAVTVSYVAGTLQYTLDVASLQDAGAYTFALKAKNGSTEKSLGSISFTADATGPGAVQQLATEVC